MDLYMRLRSCLFLLGTVSVFQFSVLPPLVYVIPVLTLLFILNGIGIFNYALWFVIGFIWALVSSTWIISKSLDPEIEGVDVHVSGYVDSLPTEFDRYIRFNFDIVELTDANGLSRQNPGKVRLYWYSPYAEIKPGEHLNLVVRLKSPHGFVNPGSFDYEAWLFKEKIRATGYVRKINITEKNNSLRFSIHYFRFQMRDRLNRITKEHRNSSNLALALILGDRSKITKRDSEVLAITGTNHLLAISGLHIGLMAGFAFFIVRWLWPLTWRFAHLFQAQNVASVCSIIAALVYALLAGFTIPTQRALIMLSVMLLYVLTNRKISKTNLLAISLIIVICIDPLAVLSHGFWLSFLAVSIIMFSVNINITRTVYYKARNWFRVQLFLYISLIPVLALMFNQIPVLSIFANLIAIPWVTMITMPLLLLSAILIFINASIASWLYIAGLYSLNIIWYYLEYLASFDTFSYVLATPSVWILFTALFGLIILLLPLSFPGRFIASVWLLPLIFPLNNAPDSGDFDVNVLDVGQGLSIIVRTQNHILLYDTGPGSSAGNNAGLSVVIPYLKHLGYKQIDKIVQSHGDNDHIGGLVDILSRIEVVSIISSVPEKINYIASKFCLTGQTWNWDNVSFEILHPDKPESFSGNNASCVLKVGIGKDSILLTGDIEAEAEYSLLAKKVNNLQASVLIVPHHGSLTSSSASFIRAVSAKDVIISSGYLNRFRLPNQDIIDKYRSSGANIFNTATDGAIIVKYFKGEFSVVSEREVSSKFWNFKK
ncbi:MAG: competence protein ComEC [Gammaproteobacteria bacterium]|jgi:competence protein ComEC